MEKRILPSGFLQLVMVVQGVMDTYPPNKNKLRMESVAASVTSPFMGYKGWYEGDPKEPKIRSSEPGLNADRRISTEHRRVSRPFSVQPKQMETLNELFLNALKKKMF